jgi:hypothetical protein
MASHPADRAFLLISASPNSTVEASQLLRLLGQAIDEPALARAADRLAGDRGDGLTQREAIAAAYATRKAEMLAELARLEAAGKGTNACALVARVFAADDDPVDRANLERNLRRWRSKISGHCPEFR